LLQVGDFAHKTGTPAVEGSVSFFAAPHPWRADRIGRTNN